MKGYRTILVGLLIAIAPAGLNYLSGIDWTHLIGPNAALVIAGAITVGMRLVTNTPPGKA